MSYRIILETRARKEFLDLPREVQMKIGDIFDDLKANPRPPASKKLTGQEGYRIRKGDYRILYTVNDRQSSVTIYRVGHRREVYR
ncbi:MAG: type II toxin-antitoxin system RelE/ParE family toxin [Deltaproteobacteria bacterium]|nr:type II toxin-antitoxin system RelE/ParE family toxin [Deltaproteobacteria bacterium]